MIYPDDLKITLPIDNVTDSVAVKVVYTTNGRDVTFIPRFGSREMQFTIRDVENLPLRQLWETVCTQNTAALQDLVSDRWE